MAMKVETRRDVEGKEERSYEVCWLHEQTRLTPKLPDAINLVMNVD